MIIGIQWLRFLAASLVILNHAMGEFPGVKAFGSFGVDIFFIISGFIISQITEGGTQDFFKKRLIRIVPLYWLFTAFVAAISYLAPHLLRSARWDPVHVLGSLFFVPLWSDAMGFEPLLKLGWTLNLEMYFYLLFFLATKVSERHRELVCTLLLVALHVAFNALPVGAHSPFHFYGQDITLEFIGGMALALLYRHRQGLFLALPPAACVALVAASFAGFWYTTFVDDFALGRSVTYGVPAFACVLGCLGLERSFQRLPNWARRACLVGGELSYPMYLVHIYVVALVSRLMGGKALGYAGIFLLAWPVTMAISDRVIRYFDAPVRRWLTHRLAHDRRTPPATAGARAPHAGRR